MRKVSIIIPMFNVEQFLEKCLHSVYQQELNEDDFEIVLIDDQSPDDSKTKALDLIKYRTNAKVIIHNTNKGLGGARNTGILESTGQYILFLDADDWYMPKTLSKILSIAEINNLDILEFGAQGISVNGEITYTHAASSNICSDGVSYYQKLRYMDSACNKLYSRSFLMNNELFFLERLYIEDYEFNTRAFYRAEKVMATDLIVARFLQSPNSITRNVDVKKRIKMQEDIITVIKKVSALSNNLENRDDSISYHYFGQRLSYLTVTLFYQLLKNKATYNELLNMKNRLKSEKMFFINYKIFDRKKELFRIILLKCFGLMRIAGLIVKLA
jgi:glycosyltransferase involved in cell wall biosynthesis